MITRKDAHSTTYDLYGNPDKLVEFRVFSLNKCDMGCKGCFYDKLGNDYNDFVSMKTLAKAMLEQGYTLETLFLLPTEIFEDKGNYKLFNDRNFSETISMFNYLGLAATLTSDVDHDFLTWVIKQHQVKIELQVNLLIKKLFDPEYLDLLDTTIRGLKDRYREDMVINLAINTGFKISPIEMDGLLRLTTSLSEDSIIETNFTFLFNDDISWDKKRTGLGLALSQISTVQRFYSQSESYSKQYNHRTLYHKPSFAFVTGNDIYLNPIVPFDEYVFIKDAQYKLAAPSYEEFVLTLSAVDMVNLPVIDKCQDCTLLETCMGKRYFALARHFDIGCHLESSE